MYMYIYPQRLISPFPWKLYIAWLSSYHSNSQYIVKCSSQSFREYKFDNTCKHTVTYNLFHPTRKGAGCSLSVMYSMPPLNISAMIVFKIIATGTDLLTTWHTIHEYTMNICSIIGRRAPQQNNGTKAGLNKTLPTEHAHKLYNIITSDITTLRSGSQTLHSYIATM